MIPSLFVTGVSTGVGKTFVARGLARALLNAGRQPAALKPIETGAAPDPLDALALARACGRPELATAEGLYRAEPPLAPYAAALEGAAAAPDLGRLAARIRALAAGADPLLVEGAGGLLVPLDARHTIADLVVRLDMPLLLVAPDALGVLSHVLACAEAAAARGLRVHAVVLSENARTPDDPSPRTNARILRERLSVPVLSFPTCADDDDALADACRRAGLLALLD